MKQDKKYTVITGASSGIGYETAKAFAKRGKNLVIVARNKGNLEKLKTEILNDNSSLNVIVKDTDLSIIKNVYQLYQDLKPYQLETWINNAGFGDYDSVANQNLEKIETMLRLNVEALVILSSLFVRDYQNIEGSKLINVSSAGGYIIVPTAVTYCASKFFVSTFTEGLARELEASNAKLQAKVLAPAATRTNFGNVANNIEAYDYDKSFGTYHTSKEMADFLLQLHDSSEVVGAISRESFEFELLPPLFNYAGNPKHNQSVIL
ncbi:SDR family NAD(P)-dependent oxidoreductase [Clostridium estertheticum]|uniref:SDR family NAD(P)-dependent oxidoreductase n=1 Tax=Clostridium estertheticum TaxID=238834 RepID=A0AA47I796_9CLOT|nr:SDR family NAD(P)-dependent oxidoreductase [Clostridium estertheticum]MBU3155793.1 SDR family NAD(P)-dependent oxidoreductase [Clostridium estertheticum]WAG62392.1 SDR family NAD(P)-dependent oxidoreductase [Clostridium estertheticum]